MVMPPKLPLTAVLIGGQHTVGFDFKPVGEPSDVDARFIYDPIVGSADASGVYTVNTFGAPVVRTTRRYLSSWSSRTILDSSSLARMVSSILVRNST